MKILLRDACSAIPGIPNFGLFDLALSARLSERRFWTFDRSNLTIRLRGFMEWIVTAQTRSTCTALNRLVEDDAPVLRF